MQARALRHQKYWLTFRRLRLKAKGARKKCFVRCYKPDEVNNLAGAKTSFKCLRANRRKVREPMSKSFTMKDLLEAGVHYGHQVRRWNPKMRPYIFDARNGIHIIDIQKTVRLLQKACNFIEETTARGGHVLFVGTKRLARDIVRENAGRSGNYFINNRWLGGTLTNFQTIRQSIHRLKRLEKMKEDGTFEKLTKKEALGYERERIKLERNLGGVKDMPGQPAAMFVVDAAKEHIAIKEARRLGIPVVAIADTNADPEGIDYIIPGNDDSTKAISLFVSAIADAALNGKQNSKAYKKEDQKGSHVSEGKFMDKAGHRVQVEKKRSEQKAATASR